MRILLLAVGRARAGPETALTEDYMARAAAMSRALGISGVQVIAAEPRGGKSGRDAEAEALLTHCPDGAFHIVLDERGKTMSSRELATLIAAKRDQGVRDCLFLIGGADGHGDAVRQRADLTLSLGSMVWPHLLVRVMMAEQIYRCLSILSGSPYHRD